MNNKNITFDQLQSALARVKKLLDGKANTSHGNHVPKTEIANNARFLRNDNTWQTITPVNIGAADRSHTHGEYINQNTFTNVKIGDTTIEADSPTDTLTLNAGANVTITPDAINDTVTIEAKDTIYTHPTNPGNRHIPSGGSSGQILRWSEDGTAAWGSENNTFTNGSVGGFTVTPENLVGNNVGMTSSSGHGYAFWAGVNGAENSESAPFKVGHEGKLYAYNAVLAGTLDGNATTATRLQTAHKFTIGNSEKYFDGSADVAWTLDEIGASSVNHMHTSIDHLGDVPAQSTGERPPKNGISMNLVYNNGYPYSYGNVLNLKGTGDGQLFIGWSGSTGAHAPVYVRSKRDTGDAWSDWAQFYTTANPQTDITGNAGTATKLATAKTITIGNTGKQFDGSGNMSWSLDEIGAVSPSHTHDRIIDSNNNIIVAQANDHCGLDALNNVNVATWYGFSISNNCSNTDNYGQVTFSVDARSGQVWTRGTVNAPAFSGALYGNANTATTLANSRKFTIGNTERYFDGSADVSWSLDEMGVTSAIQVAENDAKMDIRHNYVTKHEAAHYFEGENKWKLDVYSLGSMSANAYPTKETMIQNNCQYQRSYLVEHPSYEGEHYGDNYVGYATTHMHFTEAYQWTGRVVTDDAGSVYLNDELVLSTTSCQWADITLNFRAGWNKVEVLYVEGVGGDGWQFDPEIIVVPGGIMNKMNCYGQNSIVEHFKNAYNRVAEWAYGSVGGSTTINGDKIQANTVAPQHLAISDFSNYSQLRVGHNLSNKYGTAVYVNNDVDNHCYWCNGDNEYFPFTVNETVNPFKYGDKVGFKFDAYVQNALDVRIGIWFYLNNDCNDYMTERTADVHLNPGWNSYSTQVTIDCTEVRRAKSVAILIYKGVNNYIEVRNAVISRMISNAMIEDRAVTANKLGTIGGFQVEDRLLRGRNGTEGNNYVGMSGDGFGWAFWAGAYNGGDAPFHVGHEGHLYATNATLAGTLDGNATTATRLQNTRTFTIGNTGKNFDGSGNISWSLDEIGAAPSSHGHNFMYVKGTNTIGSVNDDTTSNWGAQGNSVHWYAGTEGLLHDQPSSWGYLLNIGQFSEVHQIWMTQASGDLLHRGGNGSGWSGSWRTILDTSNYSNHVASKSHTHTNLVTKTVSNSTLTLGTELYQYAAISSTTTIRLPSVSAFTEIHLFFNWPANVSVTMPSGVKWQQGVMYGPGHVHEFVFTYVNNIGWLGGCVVYG